MPVINYKIDWQKEEQTEGRQKEKEFKHKFTPEFQSPPIFPRNRPLYSSY